MSKRKASRRPSSHSRKPATVRRPVDPDNPTRLQAIAKREAALIAAALAGCPPLNRAVMAADLFPFNGVASSDPVVAAIETLVRQRIPGNPWNAVHTPLCKTDQSGDGYWAWIDAFRDAAFLVGVDYALRSIPSALPDWWADYQTLEAKSQQVIGALVRHAAEVGTNGGVR